MGIPGLYSKWIRKHNRRIRIIKREVPEIVSSLSFDMNGVFHRAAQMTYSYGSYEDLNKQKLLAHANQELLKVALFENIGNILLKAIVAINPINLLVLAVDGVAPVAKMDQQRKRRYIASKLPDSIFDKNQFTPGTELMFELDNYIRQWIDKNRNQLPTKVIYSPHTVSGEGEHKIFTYIRQGMYHDTNEIGSHVIYGLDADLIMLSVLSPLNEIYLMREDQKDIINIDALKAVIKQMNIDPQTFVILSFLIGNDFLPQQPSLEDLGYAFDKIISTCSNLRLSKDDNIDWSEFRKFIRRVVATEEKLLNREINRMVKYPSSILQNSTKQTVIVTNGQRQTVRTLDIDKFTDDWNHYTLDPKADSEVAKKLGISSLFYSEQRLKQMVFDYLNSLNWVFNYYLHGNKVDPLWLYSHHYTPLFRVIDMFIDEFTPNMIQMMGIMYNPVHQLLTVLPRSEHYLVPVEAQGLMQENSPLIDMYPDDFYIDYNGKNNEHTGVVLLPHTNINRIISDVSFLTVWSEERAKLFTEGHDYESVVETKKKIEIPITIPKSNNRTIEPQLKLESTDILWKAKDLSAGEEIKNIINYSPGIVIKLFNE